MLAKLAGERDAWAGLPMPIDGERLVVEPRFPGADKLQAFGATDDDSADDRVGLRLRSRFYSWSKRCDILIAEHADGRIDWGLQPAIHHFDQDLRTLGCADAWGMEQEGRAIALLHSLLNERQMKQYLMTGAFLESSDRSGVTYVFRRLKPTVAIAKSSNGESMRILCALCLHPIAYYAGSWAGAMCPTDDVVAHLMLMRGDEAMFWKRSNQHPAWRPEAGL